MSPVKTLLMVEYIEHKDAEIERFRSQIEVMKTALQQIADIAGVVNYSSFNQIKDGLQTSQGIAEDALESIKPTSE